MDEIAIFGQDNCGGGACRSKNLFIVGIPQTKIAQRSSRDRKVGSNPTSRARRRLRIHPYRHAASTGWSMRRLANIRQALRSSASKSGISSRIWAASRPEAKRSRTSLTRIRIPRTQARPPHWSALTVMRSRRLAMREQLPEKGGCINPDSGERCWRGTGLPATPLQSLSQYFSIGVDCWSFAGFVLLYSSLL